MSAHKTYSDRELLDRLKSGEQTAFSEIYRRHWELMYYHALKMLGDEDDAKDLVQELFATLWIRREMIPYHANLSGYLYVTVRNKILNLIQQQKVRRDYRNSLASFMHEMSNDTVEQMDERELLILIDKEVQNLPSKMREVFELSRKQYLSHQEIANQLNISDKTVKKQIGYAIKIIKLKLNVLTRVILIFISPLL